MAVLVPSIVVPLLLLLQLALMTVHTNAFTPSSLSFTTAIPNLQKNPDQLQHSRSRLFSQVDNDEDDDDDAWDSPEDYMDKPTSSSSSSSSTSTSSSTNQNKNQPPSLGINIGSQLEPLSPEEASQLKDEATQKINAAFDQRFDEINSMKQTLAADFEKSKQNLRFVSELRAQQETEKLMNKIDQLSNEFLAENEELRMGTKMSALADGRSSGVGLEVGSWGKVNGMDVGMGMGLMADGGSGLLGSVGSAAAANAAASGLNEDGEPGMVLEDIENRILVICDEKQDSNVQKVLTKFQSLITNKFDAPVQIESYKPTSTIPLGGNNAQCVIISTTSLSNGQSSANNILSRLLRKTIAPSGGQVSRPPSHLVLLSPLGTERIDKFPYSMTNMMNGNKLKKAREVEEVIISTVKGRLVANSGMGSPSLDYTIVKLGDIVDDAKIVAKDKLDIAPGDCLDGKVGVDAAASALLQAVALRPLARNATLSVIGGAVIDDQGTIVSEDQWEDWFLRLDGPELWRDEEGLLDGTTIVDEADADRKFEELAGFISEWSQMYQNGAKGTGLTTPVNVVRSRFDDNDKATQPAAIRNKFGVRLEFKQTNTGSAYKSRDEERDIERQRPASSSSSSSSKEPVAFKTRKQSREGGVEILVERVVNESGKNDLRVRARRCNMDDFTVVKELSEETIVKNLGKAVDVWKKK